MKISSFNVSTTLNDSDLFTFVVNGTNKNIAYSSFKTDLGVTGTLSQVGNPLAAPVLYTNGTDYGIRSIESSKGVIANVSAQNGILIGSNFVQNGVGTDIIESLTADQYSVRSIIAGSGIGVNLQGSDIVISAVSGGASVKTVVVATMDDFPTPVTGVITLLDDTDYFLQNDLTTTDRFVVGSSTTIRGPASQIVSLNYTGTGTMLTGVDPNFRVDRVTLGCPTGQLFDMSGTGIGIFQMIETNISSCDVIGTISDLFLIRFKGVAWQNIITNGIVFGGTNDLVVLDTGILFLNGGTAFDFGTSLFNNITVTNQFLEGTTGGTKFLDGDVDSANVVAGGLAVVTNNRTDPAITPLTGITTHDVRWDFLLNDSIDDTRPDAMLDTQGNALVTTIAAIDTPVKINAVWVDEGSSQFTSISDGRTTYIGEKGLTVPITVVITILATGGDKQVTGYIAINGSVIPGSAIQTTSSGTKAGNVTCIWQQTLQPNDYIEVWIENNSTTDNLTAVHAVTRVN